MSLNDEDRAKKQLVTAEAYARNLKSQLTEADVDRLKNEVAKQFFSEGGIPPHLMEGWAVLEQNREVRAQVGSPLPPGGCFTLGYQAAVQGTLDDMRIMLSESLKLPVENIRVRLVKDNGQAKPVADVMLPSDWVLPVDKANFDSIEDAANAYIQGIVHSATDWFRTLLADRLEKCDRVNPNLSVPFKRMEDVKETD